MKAKYKIYSNPVKTTFITEIGEDDIRNTFLWQMHLITFLVLILFAWIFTKKW